MNRKEQNDESTEIVFSESCCCIVRCRLFGRVDAAWLPPSLLIGCDAMAFAFFMLLLTSVLRFFHFRRGCFV